MQNYPFTPVAGQGLGLSYSSLRQMGAILPLQGFGQAKLKCYVNITNGNLIIQDRIIQIKEMNGDLEFYLIYNSQASGSDVWRLNINKWFKQLPSPNPPLGQTAILVESDGHETIYTLDPDHNIYYAPTLANGTPYLRYDLTIDQWILYYPDTQIIEYYSTQGLLNLRMDRAGRINRYEYSQNQQVNAIVGPTGDRYEIQYQNNQIAIYSILENNSKLLQQYQFDQLGRLIESTSPNGYKITYVYGANSNNIVSITQSDGTKLGFLYQVIENNNYVFRIIIGDNSAACTLDYTNYPNSVVILDALKNGTHLKLDNLRRIIQVGREQGYDSASSQLDITSYTYSTLGQIENITYPNQGQESFFYTGPFNLISKHVDPVGLITQYAYEIGTDRPKVTVIAKINYNIVLATRFVYDNDFDQLNQRHCFLRYKISSTGTVTEYRPDKYGNCSEERVYLNSRFDLIPYPDDLSPSLYTMNEWVTQQDPQQVSLNEFIYDSRGLTYRTRMYGNIDEKGEGIEDIEMSEVIHFWDQFGNLLQHQERQSATVTTHSTFEYDDLQRLLISVDPLNQITKCQYQDSSTLQKKIFPSGKEEWIQNDVHDFIIGKKEIVIIGTEEQTRNSIYKRDIAGRLVITVNPDNKNIFTFYDRQDRLGFSVSRTGIVTEYRYNAINRYKIKIGYANSIDVNKLIIFKNILPIASTLIQLVNNITDPKQDRIEYEFFDLLGRLQYTVNAKQAIAQFEYDSFGHLIRKIEYSDTLSDTQLNLLLQGNLISLNFDRTKDREWNFVYDMDGRKIAEQDPAGYCIEYRYNCTGFLLEKIYCSIPLSISLKQLNNLPSPSFEDAHWFYSYDARGQCILEIDPENYAINTTYLACGLIDKKIRYATQFPRENGNSKLNSSSEDQVTTYHYDLMGREIQREEFPNRTVLVNYDVMGNVILRHTKDLLDITSIDSNKQRSLQSRYDNWCQCYAQTNASISQLIFEIESNNQYTPEEKAFKINAIWNTQSSRSVYDSTGLKLSTVDSLGNTTFYFYDDERRLIIIIDSLGNINEKNYNNFNEEAINYLYINPVPKNILSTLTGGILSLTLRQQLNTLKDPNNDAVTFFTRDKCGQVNQVTNPEGFVTNKSYNNFNECVTELLPVSSQQPTLLITHFYEQRGLEIKAIHTADTVEIIVLREFNNIFGKETLYVSELNSQKQSFYDRLGRNIKTIESIEDNTVRINLKTFDAFNRILTKTNSFNLTTTFTYNQLERSTRIDYPDLFAYEIIIKNIFSEVIEKSNALNAVQKWSYSSTGSLLQYTNELNDQVINTYDMENRCISHQSINGMLTYYIYDAIGRLIEEIKDASDGLNIKQTFILDALGRKSKVIDPQRIITVNHYDHCGNKLQSILDPLPGLAICKSMMYNGQMLQISFQCGNTKVKNQFYSVQIYDGFNRVIGEMIDPDGLNILSRNYLNHAGQIILKIDPNRNDTFYFYNLLGKKRFEVKPSGAVIEWKYDLEGQLIELREYDQPINSLKLNKDSNLTDIKNLIQTNSEDSVTWFFYDVNGREVFQIKRLIDNLGKIIQKTYDAGSRNISIIHYVTPIDISFINTFTIESILSLISIISSIEDRIDYFVYDLASNQRFHIIPISFDESTPQAIIKECRYDANGKVIAKIHYANFISNPIEIIKMPIDQIELSIIKNLELDRITLIFYDKLEREQFIVDPEGCVRFFKYDNNSNKIQECYFSTRTPFLNSYEEIKQHLNTWAPHQNFDRITSYQYDNANRLICITDALNYSEYYAFDAIGNKVLHIDKNFNIWTCQYDRANRLISEISPTSLITQIQYDQEKQVLIYHQTMRSVERQKSYDQNNNIIKLIEDANGDEKRVLLSQYNANNLLAGTQIENGWIDDPLKAASFNVLPQQLTTLSHGFYYNSKNLLLVEIDESMHYRFNIYNADKKLIFEINHQGDVIQYDRNVFGEIVRQIDYALPISLDLNQFIYTSIPRVLLQQALVVSQFDRITTYQWDRVGCCKKIEKPSTFYYLPNEDLLNRTKPVIGSGNPQKNFNFNAFGDCIYQAELINPKINIFSERIIWFDKNSNPLAEINPGYFVTRYIRNNFGEIILKKEYANPLLFASNVHMALSELDKLITLSSLDRVYSYQYDLRGQKIAEITLNVVSQAIEYDNLNCPLLVDLTSSDLTRYYIYNALQQLISITYENGGVEYYYFDERGKKIASTQVKRTSSEGEEVINLIPLTYYGVNAAGQQVLETKFISGTQNVDQNNLPVPINLSQDDQTTLTLFDNRGLVMIQQNPENQITGFTYTPTRKQARTWSYLSNWQQPVMNQPQFFLVKHIDEFQIKYNALDLPILNIKYRDNIIVQTSQMSYNTFNEVVSEGPGDNTTSFYWKYDLLGRVWMNNENKGCQTILLYNLQGQTTASLKSPTIDLSQTTYDQLAQLISLKPEELEISETQYDALNRVIVKSSPSYYETSVTEVNNIPLTILVSHSYAEFGPTSLSWVQPQERNVIAEFILSPIANRQAKFPLVIKTNRGRCGVDVSMLPSDSYDYLINYYMIDPFTNQKDISPCFMTQGTVQFDTSIINGSFLLVPIVKFDHVVYFTGNIIGLTAIELWQDGNRLAALPIQTQADNVLFIDLVNYPSGSYQVRPIISGTVLLEYSLPFTIFTSLPSQLPLSREISCQVYFSNLDSHGELIWLVPPAFFNLPIQFTCSYLDENNLARIHQDTLFSNVYKETYTDKNGKVLNCNTEFEYVINKIEKISLSLVFANNDILPILIDELPALIDEIQNDLGNDWQIIETINDFEIIKDEWNKKINSPNTIVSYQFSYHVIAYVSPILNRMEPLQIQYWDSSLDRLACWKAIDCLGVTASGLTIDVTAMNPGHYKFKINQLPQIFYFSVTAGGVMFDSINLKKSEPHLVKPIQQFSYDRWNNIESKTDSLGNVTQFTYNYLNRLMSIVQPPVEVVQPDGSILMTSPVTRFGYNQRGFKLGTIDANSHTNVYHLDEAGQPLSHILAEGTNTQIQSYDTLGRVAQIADAREKIWRMQYDHNNHVVKMIYPSGKFKSYSYNERGLLLTEIDPLNHFTRYNYDACDNISAIFLPLGQVTSNTYNRFNNLTQSIDPDGRVNTWSYDEVGNLTLHTDLSGTIYYYFYDFKKQLIKQATQSVSHGTSIQVNQRTGRIMIDGYLPTIVNYYSPERINVPNQNLSFYYMAGRLIQVSDNTYQKNTYFHYDSEGRKVAIEVRQGDGAIVHSSQTQLDALGREKWAFDSMMVLITGYDAVNNRVRVVGKLYDEEFSQPQVSENWYLYDSADRIIIDRGILFNGQIQINEKQGLKLEYSHGFRSTETKIVPHVGAVTTILTYDEDGLLIKTNSTKGDITTRMYDLAGRRINYTDGQTSQETQFNANGWQFYDCQTKNGELVSQTQYLNFNGIGLPAVQFTAYAPAIYDQLQNYYVAYDCLQLTKTIGKRYQGDDESDYSSAEMLFDANNNVNAKIGSEDESPGVEGPIPLVCFESTFDGLILSKQNLIVEGEGNYWQPTYLSSKDRYFYTVDGHQMGSYQLVEDPFANIKKIINVTYVHRNVTPWETQEIGQGVGGLNKKDGYYLTTDQKGQYLVVKYCTDRKTPWFVLKVVDTQPFLARKFNIVNFNREIDAVFPPPLPPTYVVVAGDTFASIAQMMFGDESYADSIAAINPQAQMGQLTPGMRLEMPVFSPIHNRSDNFRPYHEFLTLIMGSLSPHLVVNTIDDDILLLNEVVGLIVMSVAQMIAPPLATALFKSFEVSLTVARTTVGAVTAALGNAVSQGLAIGLHVQPHFNVNNFITKTIEGGIGGAFPVKNSNDLGFLERVYEYGRLAVANQLVEMATGLRHQFDIKAVVQVITEQFIDSKMASVTNNMIMNNNNSVIVNNLLESIFSHHSLNIDKIAVELLGTNLGEQLGLDVAGFLQDHLVNTIDIKKNQIPSPFSSPHQEDVIETTVQRWRRKSRKNTFNKWDDFNENETALMDALNNKSDSYQSGLLNNLLNQLQDEATSVSNYVESAVVTISETLKKNKLGFEFANEIYKTLQANVEKEITVLEREWYQSGNLEKYTNLQIAQKYLNQYSIESFKQKAFLFATELTKMANPLLWIYDFYSAYQEIKNVEEKERFRETNVQLGSIMGGNVGMRMGMWGVEKLSERIVISFGGAVFGTIMGASLGAIAAGELYNLGAFNAIDRTIRYDLPRNYSILSQRQSVF